MGGKRQNHSEAIVAYDIKVDICNQLNELLLIAKVKVIY